MPFLPLTFIVGLLHLYIGWRVIPDLDAPWAAWLLGAVLVLSTLLMPLGFLARRLIRRRSVSEAAAWAGFVFMGLFSSLLVLILLRDLGLLLVSVVGIDGSALWTARAVPLLAGVVTLWGFVNARRRAAIVAVEVPIQGLPPALQGFTIAQISDIHVGPTIKGPYLQAIVDAVNGMQADMVAVTGDLVDGSVRDLSPHVAPLGGLVSRHGTFFVTGNHEYYSGAHAWIAELRRLGIKVLMNEHTVLQHGGAPLAVAGVADYGAHLFDPSHRSDPQAAMNGVPAHVAMRVLLAHQPRSAEAAERAGFQLQLSGHTHGGQFFPWNLFVPLQQPFTAGLHKLKRLWVYTSRGTGYWGPPK
ncbi:MAG: metallophosphoesterase, partial [Rhizobacter sp.]|nr:metallophosphoesterase [Rhizobacter sp.]